MSKETSYRYLRTRIENGRFSSIIILTCKNSYFFKKDIILKSKQNFLKDEKSDWDIELGLLEQNSYSADLKEAVSATFKVASTVLSFLPNKKSDSSTLTDKAYSEHLRYSWEDRPYESENREL
ncbi:hypothetical protein PCO85_05430 [Prodigiosinella aquatilis]|nr:hypothetical protein [Prodigiosinella sp. LS101]WJV54872.1 hypothetical protein PCO85_05430 [Prodigiosinella sp. LS101]WJV59235.1 hypothetical protein PCO84_05440 [Pectobacteriaceae bacterium C111]